MLTKNYDAHSIVNNQICPVNTNAAKGLGIFKEILQRMTTQLENLLSYHSKVLVTRIELHCYANYQNNKPISQILCKIKTSLKRHYQLLRVGYTWVREQKKASTPHYHLVLMLDGHKVKNSWKLFHLIKQYWQHRYDYGSVWLPKKADYRVIRNDNSELKKAVYRISYLAKIKSKPIKQSIRCYGCSQITCNAENSQTRAEYSTRIMGKQTAISAQQAQASNVLQRFLASRHL